MSTQPEPDYRIAVVLATERGRTAVVALISDLDRPRRHRHPGADTQA